MDGDCRHQLTTIPTTSAMLRRGQGKANDEGECHTTSWTRLGRLMAGEKYAALTCRHLDLVCRRPASYMVRNVCIGEAVAGPHSCRTACTVLCSRPCTCVTRLTKEEGR